VLATIAESPYARRGVGALAGTGVLGLLVPELSNPVFPAFAEALETTATNAGYSSVLCDTRASSLGEEQYVRMLLARGVAGMIFVSPEAADTAALHGHYEHLISDGVKMVFVNGFAPVLDVPDLRIDTHLAGYVATKHLIELGHREIGMVCGPYQSLAVRLMIDGWRAAHADAGLDPRRDMVAHGGFEVAGGAMAIGGLLDRTRPTGVICSSDHMAFGVISEGRRRGLRVPEDLSVVGFDDMPLAPYCAPPLTTLAQPIEQIAQAAVDELITLIEDGYPRPAGTHSKVFRPQLVGRRSTGPPPPEPARSG
jgi:DNA-binding LacI/PurR family transcriptional regulator